MTTLTPDALLTQLRWRYAVKKFDPARKIPGEVWNALEQSLVLAPSSFGLQPWKFVVITDAAVKAKLPAISWGQTQPAECSHMAVFAGRTQMKATDVERFIERAVAVRGEGARASLAGYKDVMLGFVAKLTPEQAAGWAARQCYIALGQLMASAAVLGVDTCPMEGIVVAEYDKLLNLPAQGYITLMGCALGYRAADDKYAGAPKVRFETSDVVMRV
ncbi:MAG: NAD(P)H-dependent oxidoreductase [Phycisphaerales bacterium]